MKAHGQLYKKPIGFEIVTALVGNNIVFCDNTPCSPLKVNVSEEYIVSIFRHTKSMEIT
jgi:hypothetical protein